MTSRVLISQAAEPIDLEWVEGDPVSLAFSVYDLDDDGVTPVAVDWSGSYTLQVRADHEAASPVLLTLTVTATFNTPETDITLVQADTSALGRGEYVYDCQESGGVTRFGGKVYVQPQVTR